MLTNSIEAAVAQRRAEAPAASDTIIEVRGLHKSYDEREAVSGVDLEVHAGEIFAFLGPNGAGKTTTVEILEGFQPASAGEVRVLGEDPANAPLAWRDRLGIVAQESATEPELTVRECLELYGGFYRAPRPIDEVLALAGLSDRAERRSGMLSGGERRRLDVALALIGDPELIFLDEPTTGFDPAARRAAWEVISGLRELGKTIFLTTHYMEEAERLADRIAIIAEGRIVATGTPRTLGGRERAAARISFTLPAGEVLPDGLADRIELREARASIATENPMHDLHDLSGWALAEGVELRDIEVSRPSLEDVYLQLTKEEN